MFTGLKKSILLQNCSSKRYKKVKLDFQKNSSKDILYIFYNLFEFI